MPTALIVGASRGIGKTFAEQYVADGWKVFGTWRKEDDRVALRDLGVDTLKLDVNDPNDLAGMAWQLDGERLNVVIMNAGVYGPRTSHPLKPPTDAEFDLVMRTNLLAAMRVLPVVSPNIIRYHGTFAFISSRMGSITETAHSYGMLYRVSKAAVNMFAKMAEADLGPQGGRIISLHPGWVRTDMGGPNADVDVNDSVRGMRDVIADPKTYPGGGFYDYRGQSIGW